MRYRHATTGRTRLRQVLRRPLISAFLALAAAGALFSCDWKASATPTEKGNRTVRIILLGQSLIRHDPRDYLENPLHTVAPILRSADVVFTNLEVAIEGAYCPCEPTRPARSMYMHVARPTVLDYLRLINVNLLALSNNHSWDYGVNGIRSTLHEASKRGFACAGIGNTLQEATAPAYLQVGDTRIALVANATVRLKPEVLASKTRPGVNLLRVNDQDDWERNLAAIRRAASNADVVLVYQHFQVDADAVQPGNPYGHSLVDNLTAWQERWARASIDAGATAYVAHGSPEHKGVEIYKGRPIFYGLGNFIFHSRQPVGHYEKDVWQSVIVEVTVRGDSVDSVSFVPIELDEGTPGEFFLEKRGFPEVADEATGLSILTRLAELSEAYGTQVKLDAGGARIELN